MDRVNLIIALKRAGKMLSFELQLSTVASILTKIIIFISHVNYAKLNIFGKMPYGRHFAVNIFDRANLIIAFKRGEKMLSFELRVSTAAPLLTKIFTFISQVNYDKFNLFSKVHFGHQYAVTFIDRVKLSIAFERAGKMLSFEPQLSTVASVLIKIIIFHFSC